MGESLFTDESIVPNTLKASDLTPDEPTAIRFWIKKYGDPDREHEVNINGEETMIGDREMLAGMLLDE